MQRDSFESVTWPFSETALPTQLSLPFSFSC
ncbi:hypothetical protein Zm00014a_025699 [Zea mays]|uniref:Uncharacterized protein n=1 Tax=Zea mays TaxID=4577 RepID=A0A3L6F7I0_MAIZE|nr:hypothetical protein Zm00014a_025699 [Zea mays]